MLASAALLLAACSSGPDATCATSTASFSSAQCMAFATAQGCTSGTVERWQGLPTSSFDFAANAAWGSGPNDVWFAGGYGGALHGNGSSYERLSGLGLITPLEQLFFRGAITGLWGAEGELCFVGLATQAEGSVARRRADGTVETLHATPTNLLAVWGSSARDAWAVGDSGTILHWGGGAPCLTALAGAPCARGRGSPRAAAPSCRT